MRPGPLALATSGVACTLGGRLWQLAVTPPVGPAQPAALRALEVVESWAASGGTGACEAREREAEAEARGKALCEARASPGYVEILLVASWPSFLNWLARVALWALGRIARRDGGAGRGPAPLAEGVEWCTDAPAGGICRVSYAGEVVDHERIVLWPLRLTRRGRRTFASLFYVCSPDLDCFEEDMSGRRPNHGPSGSGPLDDSGAAPGDGRPLYRFRSYPRQADLVAMVREGFDLAAGRGQTPTDYPREGLTEDGRRVPLHEFADWIDAPEAAAADAPGRAGARMPALPDGPLERAGEPAGEPPPGEVLLAEPIAGASVGTVIKPKAGEFVEKGSSLLVRVSGAWVRCERVEAEKREQWIADRTAFLRGQLGVPAVQEPGAPPKPAPAPADAPDAAQVDEQAKRLGVSKPDGAGAAAGDEAAEDARTLWCEWDDHGERYKTFRTAVFESRVHDWNHPRLDGQLTCLHSCKAMEKLRGSPRRWLEAFLQDKHISPKDRVAHELRTLVDVLEEAACFDQLNLGGLACLEMVVRRINLLVDAYKEGGAPNFANARYLTPLSETDEIIAPGLKAHLSRRAREDWEVIQGTKKAEAIDNVRGGMATDAAAAGTGAAETGDGGAGKGRGKLGRRGRGPRGLAPPPQG